MPKDKKKERRPSTSDDSDSGPEDKGPAKKAKPTAATSGTPHCSMENGEPTWNLGGGMKFVKVRFQSDIQKNTCYRQKHSANGIFWILHCTFFVNVNKQCK